MCYAGNLNLKTHASHIQVSSIVLMLMHTTYGATNTRQQSTATITRHGAESLAYLVENK